MDLNALVRLIYAKHELLLGISITLLLIVTVLMLVRSVMEDRQAEKKSDRGGDLDTKTLNIALEGAMKKVLADKSIQGALMSSGAGASSETDDGQSLAEAQELKKALHEKEARIAALMTDIESLKAAAESAQPTADGGVSVPGVDIRALQIKLADLQAKLAEYEIIEDDIADLSMYKEENKKLKAELATLKAVVETAQTQVHAASVSAEPAPRTQDPVQMAQAAVKAPPLQEKFELNTNDSVMNEFAKAVSSGATEPAAKSVLNGLSFESQLIVSSDSPLADPQAAIDAILGENQSDAGENASVGTTGPDTSLDAPVLEVPLTEESAVVDSNPLLEEALDTNKLQAEVSKLAAELESMAIAAEGESSVLDESLDTDKLMKELTQDLSETASAPPSDPIESPRGTSVASVKPEIVESGTRPPQQAAAEDDLLAEFKDVDFQTSKTKGS